jgi:hypothetical protein
MPLLALIFLISTHISVAKVAITEKPVLAQESIFSLGITPMSSMDIMRHLQEHQSREEAATW